MDSSDDFQDEKKSLITTSNRPPSEWGLIFADSTAATAILDRLLHHCTVLTIRGESYRLLEQKKAGLRLKAATVTDKVATPPSSNKEKNLL